MTLCLGFQNCVNELDFYKTDSATSLDSPLVLHEGQISELQPLNIQIKGTGMIHFPEGLPEGSLFDQGSRQLNWIPRRGQSGNYSIQVRDEAQEIGVVKISVDPINDVQLKISGPPFHYKDGDVGYIFVHGAGDVDRCEEPEDLVRYWGVGPSIIAPDESNRLVACYDSRKAVADVAFEVAGQLLNAKCGTYNKCIIITHSMGGLLMEHMFLHTREPQPTDPILRMYDQRELYKAVRDKTLFVISLSSAAGGSKSANIVNNEGELTLGQEFIGDISRFMGVNTDSTRNLTVSYASHIAAPFTEDPGIPFFMVPGFTEKTAAEATNNSRGLLKLRDYVASDTVFNGDSSLAALDTATVFQSRSDGLVDFRSACGVASDNEEEGPGRDVPLEDHFRYCWGAKKKSNHFVWFLSNMNHYIITGQDFDCSNEDHPCTARFPQQTGGTFSLESSFTGWSAVQVIRSLLGEK